MSIKLVRRSVFETNSSSCHSISLSSGDVYDSISPNEYGVIVVGSGEFGWQEETYSDPEARLNYAYIYAMDWSGEKKEDFLSTLKEVVKEHTGATDVVHHKTNSKWGYDYGYIDHQSVESQDLHYLFEDLALLKNFIFGSDSYIETDNDNH